MLTAKAVQHVLAQLGETDLIVCQWLNNFASQHSPLGGDAFIELLMKQVWSCVTILTSTQPNAGYLCSHPSSAYRVHTIA